MRLISNWQPHFLVLFGVLVALSVGSAAAQDASVQITPLKMDPKLNQMLPDDIRNAGVLKLATDAHYPPCESFTEDQKTMIGWEPDMWNALGQLLGVTVTPVSIEFAGLIPGVVSGRYDIAMECISDNPKREEQVTFVDVIYARSAAFTLESNTTITDDPLSFCGLKTATQQGTNFVTRVTDIMSPHCTENGRPPIENSVFPSVDATLLALNSGRVDFVLNNAMSVADLKKKAPQPIRVVDVPMLPTSIIGIVVNKDNMQLANALLAASKALHETGTYDQIIDKWDLGLLRLDEPGINLTTANK